MKNTPVSIVFVFIMIYGFAASGWAAERVPVFVSIVPQAYFVQQIGKDLVDVQVLVEPGADPHTYEPKPQQMVALSKAALYFAVGIEFETAKLAKITAVNPRMQVVHTDHGIMKFPMADTDHHQAKDEHGNGVHHQAGLDPHIWLSPPLVMLQARSILAALQAVDPAHRSVYEANYRAFVLDLVDLDAQLRATFDGLKGASFMVLHPSWGTFAHTYGLKQVPIEIDGKSPKPAQLGKLIERAQSDGITVVFVQPQFSSKSAQQIAKAIGGRVVVVDPLAGDWANNLRLVAQEIKHAFE
ncbi:MAG: zinc ABC transporter substrate-binding protein [Desulfobacteraceae bacterium]|nr:zinc ABC transporter substrate-binding protein [Desulfobacteraceae bacterium]